MRRRDFIKVIVGSTAAFPLAARAQQPSPPVIGFLSSASPDEYTIRLRAFRQGLKDAGYVEGQNVTIEYRWADDQYNRLPALAAELVHRQVNVLVAGGGTPSAMAAKAATTTIPIVFAIATDPVASGFVASLDKPGGNITGVTNLNVEMGPKRLQLLRELLPNATTIAVLFNPNSPALGDRFLQDLQPAARVLGMQLRVLNASTKRDFDTVFAALAQHQAARFSSAPTFFSLPRSNNLPRWEFGTQCRSSTSTTNS